MRYNRIIAPIVLITMLSGCSSRLFSLDKGEPNSNYQICAKLKRDMIFYNNDPNHNFQMRSPNDMAIFVRQFQQYNCAAVLAHKDNVPFTRSALSAAPPGVDNTPEIGTPTPPTRHSGNVTRRPARRAAPRERISDSNTDGSIPDRYK